MEYKGPLSASGRPMRDLADSTLRKYQCAWCGQRLDRMRKSAGNCSAIWERDGCTWHEVLQPEPGFLEGCNLSTPQVD